jgi:hypothetical protein
MLFEGMTFAEANADMSWTDWGSISWEGLKGLAKVDGGMSTLATWIAKPRNRQIVEHVLNVALALVENVLKDLCAGEGFNPMELLTSTLTEIGMGHLLKTDKWAKQSDEAAAKAKEANKTAEKLANRNASQKAIDKAKEKETKETKKAKNYKGMNDVGKTLKEGASKTSGEGTKETVKKWSGA